MAELSEASLEGDLGLHVEDPDPDPGTWTLSSVVASASVCAQAGLAPLLGHPTCWQSLCSVTSPLFGWVPFPQPWALAWPGGQETGGRP